MKSVHKIHCCVPLDQQNAAKEIVVVVQTGAVYNPLSKVLTVCFDFVSLHNDVSCDKSFALERETCSSYISLKAGLVPFESEGRSPNNNFFTVIRIHGLLVQFREFSGTSKNIPLLTAFFGNCHLSSVVIYQYNQESADFDNYWDPQGQTMPSLGRRRNNTNC